MWHAGRWLVALLGSARLDSTRLDSTRLGSAQLARTILYLNKKTSSVALSPRAKYTD
jgi:hypothetical protein